MLFLEIINFRVVTVTALAQNTLSLIILLQQNVPSVLVLTYFVMKAGIFEEKRLMVIDEFLNLSYALADIVI